eukprot:201115-Rhodomonas_salina.1
MPLLGSLLLPLTSSPCLPLLSCVRCAGVAGGVHVAVVLVSASTAGHWGCRVQADCALALYMYTTGDNEGW